MIKFNQLWPKFLANTKKADFWILFFLLTAGLFSTFIIPPFQKPDEFFHYDKALAVASGDFSCANGKAAVPESYRAIERLGGTNSIPYRYDFKFGFKSLFRTDYIDENLTNSTSEMPCHAPLAGYLAAAGVIRLTQFFHTPYAPIIAFFLARLFNFVIFFGVFWWCLKKINPEFKWLLVIFTFIPMVWQQTSAIGYDALLLTAVLPLFTALVNLHDRQIIKHKKSLIKYLIIFCLSMLIIQITKAGYWLLLPLLMILPWHLVTKKKPLRLIIPALCIGLCLLLSYQTTVSTSAVNAINASPASNTSKQIEFLLKKPLFLFDILITNRPDRRLDSYLQSALGNFGWLDYQLGLPGLFLIVLIVCYCFYQAKKHHHGDVSWSKFDLLILVLCTILGPLSIMTFFFLSEPVGNLHNNGVQGRYFLPFAFLFFIVFHLINVTKHQAVKRIFVGLICLSILFSYINVTYYRYFDFSQWYDLSKIYSFTDQFQKFTQTPEQYDIKNLSGLYRVPVNQGTKLIGFSFMFQQPTPQALPIMSVKLLTNNCQELQWEGYLDNTSLRAVDRDATPSATLYTKLHPEITINDSEICYLFEELVKLDGYNEQVQLISNDNEPSILPLMLR